MNADKNKQKTISIISVSICILMILLIILGRSVYQHDIEKKCKGRLRGLGQTVALFAMDCSEDFPKSFAEIADGYAEAPRLYRCPGDSRPLGSITNVNQWTSYVYLFIPSSSSPDTVQIYCPAKNHGGKFVNVMYVDNSVESVPVDEFPHVLKHGRRMRKKK